METSHRKELDRYRDILEGLQSLRETLYINRSGNKIKDDLIDVNLENKPLDQYMKEEKEENLKNKICSNINQSEIETFSSTELITMNNQSRNHPVSIEPVSIPIPITKNYFASPYRDNKNVRDRLPEYAKRYFEKKNENTAYLYPRYKYF